MSKSRKQRLGYLAGFAFLVALGFGPMPDVAAQTSPPVTTECEGCGSSGSKVPGRDAAWAYPEHACRATGESDFYVTFGLGRNHVGPANFYVRFTGGPLPDQPLGTLAPGHQLSKFVTTVAPGEAVGIQVFAYSALNGAPVRFGDGSLMRDFTLVCDCPQPPATTVPATTTPATTIPPTSPPVTPPPATPTTTPGTPTVPPPSSVPGTPPGITELPSVGWDAWRAVLLALGTIAAGVGLVVFAGRAVGRDFGGRG